MLNDIRTLTNTWWPIYCYLWRGIKNSHDKHTYSFRCTVIAMMNLVCNRNSWHSWKSMVGLSFGQARLMKNTPFKFPQQSILWWHFCFSSVSFSLFLHRCFMIKLFISIFRIDSVESVEWNISSEIFFSWGGQIVSMKLQNGYCNTSKHTFSI